MKGYLGLENSPFDPTGYISATRGSWKVFYSDASGLFTELSLGASGTVLQSNGASSAPSFSTPTAGGGVGLETVLMLMGG